MTTGCDLRAWEDAARNGGDRASSVTSAILEGDLMRNIHCLNNISAWHRPAHRRLPARRRPHRRKACRPQRRPARHRVPQPQAISRHMA
ncbi:MAG: hypothetical protein ACLTMP_05380 [Eggerthella lenta]